MYSPFLGHSPEAALSDPQMGLTVPHHTSWSLEAGLQLEARADEVKCVHLRIQNKNQPLFSCTHVERGRLGHSGAPGSIYSLGSSI